MMNTSEEPVIYDIGYKTPGKVWSVKRMVYETHGALPQTMHPRAVAIRQLIVRAMTFRLQTLKKKLSQFFGSNVGVQ